jgi:hypothetical protein
MLRGIARSYCAELRNILKRLTRERILSCEPRRLATVLEAARTATNSLLATATDSLRSSIVEGDRRRSMAAGNQGIISARIYGQYFEELAP